MGSKISSEDKAELEELEKIGLNKKEIKKRKKEFYKMFPTGKIKRSEFYLFIKHILDESTLKNTTQEELDTMFRIFDADGSGEIDFVEFELAFHLFSKKKSPEESIKFCLRCLDFDGNGELSKDELLVPYRRLFREIPSIRKCLPDDINTPEKVIDSIFKEIDTDGNGNLSAEEIILFMKHNKDKYEYYGLNQIFGVFLD